MTVLLKIGSSIPLLLDNAASYLVPLTTNSVKHTSPMCYIAYVFCPVTHPNNGAKII